MKKAPYLYQVLIAFAGTAVVTAIVIKQLKLKKIRRIVSDAGYETAYDIHFPLSENRLVTRKG